MKEAKKETGVQVVEKASTIEAYVDSINAVRENQIVSEIHMITEQTKQMVLFNTIEIGRRLTEAKALVKHGQWAKWLEERVDYSQRTANNFMKIYKEYGESGLASKSQSIANLSYTNALALLEVPQEDRQAFAEENNVKDMTIKELKESVAALKEEKQSLTSEIINVKKQYEAQLAEKDEAKASVQAESEKLEGYIRLLEKQAKEAEANKQKEIKAELDKVIQSEKAKLDKVAVEKKSLQAEIDSLREQQNKAIAEARQVITHQAEIQLAEKDKELADTKLKMQEKIKQVTDNLIHTKTKMEEEQAKNELAGELAKCQYLIEVTLDNYAEVADILMKLKARQAKEADILFKDLENSMATIRKKAQLKVGK